ncbi:regulatory solute carrier protein family 1 member 1 isoform X1 [Hyla sarda]|uniref:regulatory solute carrier protein family 1 member 1 isoform X1 n=1 Tax=Hyla sarda TaxID=327740 RepID=UPI0024C27FAE|nr:regulatory solute carrier protein family 1 member 1 isoform X1 [Hyla sarda]
MMHVCVICSRRGRTTDKESTSEAGPSLVPAMDGSTPPLPPAHPAPTRTPGTGSGDVPHEDVACSSSFHAGGGEVMADTSDPSDSTIAHDQGLAASLSPPLSVAGRGPEPALPAAEFTVTSDAGLVVHEESGSVPRPGDVSPHSISALEGDGGRDVTPAPGAITEDMMELDTQIIPDLHGCRPGVNVIVQNPESQNVSCNDLLTDPEKSEDADIVNKQDHLKPLSSSGQDGGDGCFSLAAALKELHKLLIISGQGSAQTGEDGALGSGDDRALGSEDDRALGSEDDRALGSGDDGALGSGDDRALGSEDDRALGSGDDGANVIQGTDQESGQNGDLDNDLHQEDGMSHPVTEETSPCIEADAPGDSFQVSSDCSGDFMESSAVMGSAPGQTLPGPVPDHDTITGVMGNSTDPAVSKQRPELSCDQGEAVGEGRSSVPPSDPPSPSDVERIVGAGFTAQDALVALERADGNVELALLTLLARNIVVPT